MSAPFQIRTLPGYTPYEEALDLQRQLVDEVAAGNTPETLLLLEHEPVITLGKSAKPAGVLASPAFLASQGISVHRIERGGQATVHGPGQLVGYPIINLHHRKIGAKTYVNRLEQVMIDSFAALGLATTRQPGLTGIFCAQEAGAKVGALGVRITRGITYHGFAMNISCDLSLFQLIVPCGLTHIPTTTLAEQINRTVPMDQVRTVVANCFTALFQ